MVCWLSTSTIRKACTRCLAEVAYDRLWGCHSVETLMGYFEEHNDWELGYAFDYLDTRDRARMVDNVFRAAYSSVACLAIFTVQDILKLGNEARMNMPSSFGNNWKWRMRTGSLNNDRLNEMRYLASVFLLRHRFHSFYWGLDLFIHNIARLGTWNGIDFSILFFGFPAT